MSAFYDLSKTPRNILNQAIVRAIVSENNGAWFDPSDLSTLYQDAAGTIPVTAVERPVGKMLDKSGNGYHATQSITASRPTLSARYNLLTKTEDFSAAVWAKSGTTASARTINFSATNSRVVYAYLGSGDFTITAIFSPLDVGKKIRLSFWASGLDGIAVGGGGSPDLTIPDTGVVSYTRTGLTSVTNIGIVNSSDGLAKSVTLRDGFGVSLVLGTTSGPYQRVNTATDYDTDERYFPKYLRFDGVDDYLNLPYMGLYAGGSASVVCSGSFSKTGVEATVLGERSSSSTSPAYRLALKGAGEWLTTQIRLDDGATYLNAAESFVANLGTDEPKIFSIIDSGVKCSPRINGILGIEKTYARSGTITLNNTVFGATVTSTSGAFLRANIYGLIITKSALTDSQRLACERHLSRKSGVQL